jgi:hypothetical protein
LNFYNLLILKYECLSDQWWGTAILPSTLGDGCRQEGHLYSGTIETVETYCHIYLGFIKQPENNAAGTLDGVWGMVSWSKMTDSIRDSRKGSRNSS